MSHTSRHSRIQPACGFAGFAALLAALAPAAAAQSVKLQPLLAPGTTTYVETTAEAKQSIQNPGGGGAMTFEFEMLTGMLCKVESADGDGAKLTHTYDRQCVKADSPMISGEFDSDIRTDDELLEFAEIFGPSIGESFTVELGPDRMVKAVTGVDKVADKIKQAAGFNPLVAQFTNEMTNEQTADELNTRYALYPNKEVKAGDKWSRTLHRTAGPLGKMATEYEFTVDSVTSDTAIVKYTGAMKQEAPATETGNPGIKAMHVKEGAIKGTATFDARSGALMKDEQTTQIKVELELSSPGGGEEGDGEQAAPRLNMHADVEQVVRFTSEQERAREKADNEAKAKAMKEAKKKPAPAEKPEGEPEEPKKP